MDRGYARQMSYFCLLVFLENLNGQANWKREQFFVCLSLRKFCYGRNYFLFICLRKRVQNVPNIEKSHLEKIPECVCVRVCESETRG